MNAVHGITPKWYGSQLAILLAGDPMDKHVLLMPDGTCWDALPNPDTGMHHTEQRPGSFKATYEMYADMLNAVTGWK